MVHVPMLQAFEAIWGVEGVNGNVMLKALMCLSSVVLAYILHRLVELPFMFLFRRPAQSWLPATGGNRAS